MFNYSINEVVNVSIKDRLAFSKKRPSTINNENIRA